MGLGNIGVQEKEFQNVIELVIIIGKGKCIGKDIGRKKEKVKILEVLKKLFWVF